MENSHDNYEAHLKEEYLTAHEAAELLEVNENELRGLAQQHEIPTHNVAGVFLRFKKKDIEELKNKWRIQRELFPEREAYFSHHNTVGKPTFAERVRDFWHFNDFYIACSAAIAVLLYFIVSSQ